MYNPIQLIKTISTALPLLSRSTWRRGFLLIPSAFACLAFSPQAEAACNQGCDANENTFLGESVLDANTSGVSNVAVGFEALFSNTGSENTAIGYQALVDNTTGHNNTATGIKALFNNTTGFENTATGTFALFFNTTGFENTAAGGLALLKNTTGSDNTANGFEALEDNTTGNSNTANGSQALFYNTIGNNNTANGFLALFDNTTGNSNTASGYQALAMNTTGSQNTAIGQNSLSRNTTGNNNIALGFSAGTNLSTGGNNIDIGNKGVTSEIRTIRIGTVGTHTNAYVSGISGVTVAGGVGVIIDTNGHLGTVVSSARFKEDIQPMDKTSETILALEPVTFRYRKDLDPAGIPQFGLVAEQVEKVNPDLVARDDQGKPYTVRYEAVNAMLLNEFLKEHRKVEEQAYVNLEQQETISELKSAVNHQQKDFQSAITQQQKEIEALTSQIRKVSDELHASKAAPKLVVENQ